MEESLSMSRGLCSYALLSRGCFGRRNEIYRGGLRATTSHASLSPPDLFVPGPKGRESRPKINPVIIDAIGGLHLREILTNEGEGNDDVTH